MHGTPHEADTMSNTRDENQRRMDGDLPDDTDPFVDSEVVGKPLVTVADSLDELAEAWGRKDEAVSTGFVQLDYLLSGGIRPGDMLALVGLAKGGKSALWGQVLYQLAEKGALGVYASVEMPRAEVTARWITHRIFLQSYFLDDAWAVSYGDVLYGKAHRGEDRKGKPLESQRVRDTIKARLAEAMGEVKQTGQRLFVEHLAPGSTCRTLRGIIEQARAQTGHQGLVVLLVDPIQRLFAHESEACKGAALDRMNSDETQRVSMVAQQLIGLAQDKALNVAILFTSDTTKGAALNRSADSATDMRGTYMLNHAATAIFDVTSDGFEALCSALAGNSKTEADKLIDELHGRLDAPMLTSAMGKVLGAKAACLNCSANRRGPNGLAMFTFVPGAMTFAEADELNIDDLFENRVEKPKPKAAKGTPRKGGKR
jgi:hypothetical protein